MNKQELIEALNEAIEKQDDKAVAKIALRLRDLETMERKLAFMAGRSAA